MTPLLEFLLRQGDNALVLGHRTSEWCGVGPALEEDIALANTALDLIGQAQLWLGYAAEVENDGRSADDLAYHRDVYDFRNLLMLEVPNEDFGRTILRQFLFDAFEVPWLTALSQSSDARVAEIAAKSLKEARYHLDRSAETAILSEAIPEAKRRFLSKSDPDAGSFVTVDTPVPYQISELLQIVDDAMGKLDNPENSAPYLRLKSRINALRVDSRFSFMFGGLGARATTCRRCLRACSAFPSKGVRSPSSTFRACLRRSSKSSSRS